MSADLRISTRFLFPYSHGRGEDGKPEWPPSPLRLFQALVAASSALHRKSSARERRRADEALLWLEAQVPPEIYAPKATPTEAPYSLMVPDNAGDLWGKSWSRGGDLDPAIYRSEKVVNPMRLSGEAVHYVYHQAEGVEQHLESIREVSRSITHLGWGIDVVVGDATTESFEPEPDSDRWIPDRPGGRLLRRPIGGTYDDCDKRYRKHLGRIKDDLFHPVPPLTTFEVAAYGRATEVLPRPFAAFRILEPVTGDRVSLEATRRARDVAAWVRHVVGEVCEGWPYGPTHMFVHGHLSESEPIATDLPQPRFSYLPLLTLNPKNFLVEGITRVLVVAPAGCEKQVEWIRQRLVGVDLMWEGEAVAYLEALRNDDWVLGRYVGTSDRWSTVTPIVIPGYSSYVAEKTDRLIRRAFVQAGYEPDLISYTKIEYRHVGFRRGVDLASKYLPPDKVIGPMTHVRVRFPEPITGPLSIGSGRHRGVGVFAIDP